MKFTGPTVWSIGEKIEALVSQFSYSIENLIQFLTIFQHLLSTPYYYLNDAHWAGDSAKMDTRTELLLEWIREHLAEAEAAAQVKMSPPAFSRWFKARLGRVFQRYINELRVAKVCARLADTGEGITQAAFECGYNNLPTLTGASVKLPGLRRRNSGVKAGKYRRRLPAPSLFVWAPQAQ